MNDIARACVRIEADGQEGSGFLVTSDLVATCRHVVVGALMSTREVLVFFSGNSEGHKASVMLDDKDTDCALLKLHDRIADPPHLRLGEGCHQGDDFETHGYPISHKGALATYLGRLVTPDGQDTLKKPALVLYSDQVAAGKGAKVKGLSGAPVLIGGRVVGYLKRMIGDAEDADDEADLRAEEGRLFAYPSANLLKLYPGLGASGQSDNPGPQDPYRQVLYVARNSINGALAALRQDGGIVAVVGHLGSGKTWTIHYLIDEVRRTRPPIFVVYMSLYALEERHCRSMEDLALNLAIETSEAVARERGEEPDHEGVDRLWKKSLLTPNKKLSDYLKSVLEKYPGSLLLVAVDDLDRIDSDEVRNGFVSFLRSLRDRSPQIPAWRRLRLLLGCTTTVANDPLKSSAVYLHHMRLDEFGELQFGELFDQHGLERSAKEIAIVKEFSLGNPRLLRIILHRSRQSGLPPSTWLARHEAQAVFDPHLERLLLDPLQRDPALHQALCQAICTPKTRLPSDPQERRLTDSGLIEWTADAGYRLRYKLYERYIHLLCHKNP